MTPLLKSLFGNGSNNRDLTEEMRAVLHEIQLERSRYQTLVEGSRASVDRLQQLGAPIAKAGSDVDAVAARLGELEQRLEAMGRLSAQYQKLDERAEGLAQSQQTAESQIANVVEESERVRSAMEEIGSKIDLALGLRDQLVAFLEVEKPFQLLRGEAEALRGQVDGTGEHIVRLREQHDRLLDANKLAMAKMEALDRRRDELGRSLQDKERRVSSVEEAIRTMDGVQITVNDVRREMQTLKAMADLLGQKTAALEAQREPIERALAQAEHLDRAMRQVDAGVRQQQENETTLGALHEQLAAVRSLHEAVVERSHEISQLQHEIDERTQATRQDLATVTDETKKTVDRFDFERRGMESVTQRVADLRASVSDCEGRYRGLSESSRAVGELNSKTQALATQLQTLSAQAAAVDGEMAKLQGIRRDLDDTGRTAGVAAAMVSQIEQSRPAVEAALHDLERLSGAHATVKDALEQTQLVDSEITRVRESQSETQSWLAGVERSVGELRDQVGELFAMAPTIEFVQKQTQRIGVSMSEIESQREFVETLRQQMADLETLSGQMDERGRQLQARMDAAEQRFAGLAAHAEEAERLSMTVATVSSGLSDAGREADEIKKTVAAIEARAESVEALAEQTKTLRKELEQRQRALAETTKDLQQVSTLREEAAASAQQLDELVEQLASALSTAEKRVTRVAELSTQLEDRTASLNAVKQRLDHFEERLAEWRLVDQQVAQSLEQIDARQGIVEAVKSDLDRMFVMAEKTATDVRAITSAHRELEESRELLNDVTGRLKEIRNTASALDERKRQLSKAEEQLARAEGLLGDVRSSYQALQGQKAIVDQAVEKAGSLQFLVKQADAAIEGLREKRRTKSRLRSTVAEARPDDDADDSEDQAEAA
jgi:chromosome segregation ATPase